jgi:hypothetical protein
VGNLIVEAFQELVDDRLDHRLLVAFARERFTESMDSQKVATTTCVSAPTDRVSTVASRNPLSVRSCGNTVLKKCSRQYRSTPSTVPDPFQTRTI